MIRTKLKTDHLLGIAIILLATAVSPLVLKLFSGRDSLPLRVNLSSGLLCLFLFLVGLAALIPGKTRQSLFVCLAIAAPIVLIAAFELLAIKLHLADRVLRIEDYSVLSNYARFPAAHFMSESSWVPDTYPKRYKPFKNPDVRINELGLRTEMPKGKSSNEWRVALTGGSTVWGAAVIDAETIPAQLQSLLRERGINATILNFGMPGAQISDELALLKESRNLYQIDRVVFYTGGNDTIFSYRNELQKELGGVEGQSIIASFELFRTFNRLWMKLIGPSEYLLARIDRVVLPHLERYNSLRDGILAADKYCSALAMRCDFVLQPVLVTRKALPRNEREMRDALELLYPRIESAVRRMYAGAIAAGPTNRVHDCSDALDAIQVPLYFDIIHVNERGNRSIAEQLVSSLPFGESHK
jgi:hypothetical protein